MARDEDDLHYELIYHTQYDEQSDEVNPVLVDHDVIDQQVVDDLDTDSDETVSDDGTSETINDVEESDEESSARDTDETEHDDDPVGFNEEAYQQAHDDPAEDQVINDGLQGEGWRQHRKIKKNDNVSVFDSTTDSWRMVKITYSPDQILQEEWNVRFREWN